MLLTRSLDFTEIPVVDLEPLLTQPRTRRNLAVEAIARACENSGFMYIRHHGVPQSLIDDMLAESHRFFASPIEDRMSVASAKSRYFRGYLPVKYVGASNAGQNVNEAFQIMHERPADLTPLDGPNQWPESQPRLKEVMSRYFDAMIELNLALLEGAALALGKDVDFFKPFFTQPLMMLRLLHYPPQPAALAEGEMGMRPHTDGGVFTILYQDSAGGLEVKNRAGEWVGATPIRDAFVVNIGDMMNLWSNRRFPSTPHRVFNREGVDRYSIPCQFYPNYYSRLEPLVPARNGEETTVEPFISGEHMRGIYSRIWPHA